jgi:hypothetical protein
MGALKSVTFTDLMCAFTWQEDELKGAVVLVYANKQVKRRILNFSYCSGFVIFHDYQN